MHTVKEVVMITEFLHWFLPLMWFVFALFPWENLAFFRISRYHSSSRNSQCLLYLSASPIGSSFSSSLPCPPVECPLALQHSLSRLCHCPPPLHIPRSPLLVLKEMLSLFEMPIRLMVPVFFHQFSSLTAQLTSRFPSIYEISSFLTNSLLNPGNRR